MAVILVEGPNGNKTLVEARTKSKAIAHVAAKEYKATTLNTTDMVKHIKAGMEVETVVEKVKEEKTEVAKSERPVSLGPKPAAAK